MGCCGSSSSGPSHASFMAAGPPDPKTGHATGNWKVTRRDGTVSWYASQIVAFAEAGVAGGSVQWVDGGPPTEG